MTRKQEELLRGRLKAAKKEERQWAKAYNRAERAMLRVGAKIDKMEARLAAVARTQR